MKKDKKIIIAVVSIFAVLLLIGIVSLFLPRDRTSSEVSLYTDPGSGEIVADNTPLTQSTLDNPDANAPTYLGFSFLSDRGLSIEQVEFTKNALYEYSQQQSNSFQEISLIKDSARYGAKPSDPVNELQFNIRINREDLYHVTLTYSNLDSVTVKLYERDQKTLLFTKE